MCRVHISSVDNTYNLHTDNTCNLHTGNARMEVPTIALFMSVCTQENSCYAHSGSLTVRLSSSPLSSLPNYPLEGTFPLAKLDRYWPSCQNYNTCVQTVIPHLWLL